jgi:hypothetical protein
MRKSPKAGDAKRARTEERRSKGLLTPAEVRTHQKGLLLAAFFAGRVDPFKMMVEFNELPFLGITDSPKHLHKQIQDGTFPPPDVGGRHRRWKLSTLMAHLNNMQHRKDSSHENSSSP